jgi:large repetitive protein
VIGASPGRTADFVIADFSSAAGNAGGAGAIGESFSATSDLDMIGVSRRFLATHPDEFDQLIVFTEEPLLTDAFAYEVTVSNDIAGLGMATYSHASAYGSAGRLQSMQNMDALSKYPDDPRRRFHGQNSTLGLLGHEFGHRWLAFLAFRDGNSQASQALLGRDQAHWSFFFDSDASVVEGSDIVDHGNGSFSTRAAPERYSLLDQYAMGLVDQTQVPPFFYVENPVDVVPPKTAESQAAVGVTFSGTRRNVTIDDVIAVMGPRTPSAAHSPREFRQAFVYVVAPGRTADPIALEKLDRIRMAWDQFVSSATDSRMRVETRLNASAPRRR